jgi:hypothetical protein
MLRIAGGLVETFSQVFSSWHCEGELVSDVKYVGIFSFNTHNNSNLMNGLAKL